jgi:hypothetical protein
MLHVIAIVPSATSREERCQPSTRRLSRSAPDLAVGCLVELQRVGAPRGEHFFVCLCYARCVICRIAAVPVPRASSPDLQTWVTSLVDQVTVQVSSKKATTTQQCLRSACTSGSSDAHEGPCERTVARPCVSAPAQLMHAEHLTQASWLVPNCQVHCSRDARSKHSAID